MLFVGFCGRFLRQTLDLSKHDPNEYAVDLRRSLGANRVRRDLPNLVAREPALNERRSLPRAFCGTLTTPADSTSCCNCSRPVMAQSGHPTLDPRCPLLGVKRTSRV
jgi:hypothetical protein